MRIACYCICHHRGYKCYGDFLESPTMQWSLQHHRNAKSIIKTLLSVIKSDMTQVWSGNEKTVFSARHSPSKHDVIWDQWPLKSLDLNPLDHWFWNALKEKVYEGRQEPFTSIGELKKRVQEVWKSAWNEQHLKKSVLQFKKKLNAVIQRQGEAILH